LHAETKRVQAVATMDKLFRSVLDRENENTGIPAQRKGEKILDQFA